METAWLRGGVHREWFGGNGGANMSQALQDSAFGSVHGLIVWFPAPGGARGKSVTSLLSAARSLGKGYVALQSAPIIHVLSKSGGRTTESLRCKHPATIELTVIYLWHFPPNLVVLKAFVVRARLVPREGVGLKYSCWQLRRSPSALRCSRSGWHLAPGCREGRHPENIPSQSPTKWKQRGKSLFYSCVSPAVFLTHSEILLWNMKSIKM